VGLQIESTVVGLVTGVTTIDAVALPFNVAVIVTVWFAVTVPAVTVKVAEVAPAATGTEAGVVNAVPLSDRATVEPPVGAAFDKVTAQLAVAPETTEVGEHCNPVTVGALC